MFSSKRSKVRRPVIYAAVSAAAIAAVGLLASTAMASTTQFPSQAQGVSLYNNYGTASGTATVGQYGQRGDGSVAVSGTVSSYGISRGAGNHQGVTEEVFLSGNSGRRGALIGSAGPGQSSQFSGSLNNTTGGTITLCVANQGGGNVRDCTSQSITVSIPQPSPTPQRHHRNH